MDWVCPEDRRHPCSLDDVEHTDVQERISDGVCFPFRQTGRQGLNKLKSGEERGKNRHRFAQQQIYTVKRGPEEASPEIGNY